ncbi:tetratricopeptide repeat protein 36 [Echinops telfairi]|uniref:Tetratricopeptide repeat protein 36 n=1 Tax=Echinops telfairi TaxID=9371 RepID=A0AC55CMJ8_ECHTE|nr:tetratricopeptide repeat protein 36 [Echinops telfairi]
MSTPGTPSDQAVLQAIFNPDTPFGDVAGLDMGEDVVEELDEDAIFPGEQLGQCKALELQGVMAAEAGDLSTALERFGQAICLLPERASAYNNRAQARRLQGDVAGCAGRRHQGLRRRSRGGRWGGARPLPGAAGLGAHPPVCCSGCSRRSQVSRPRCWGRGWTTDAGLAAAAHEDDLEHRGRGGC